MAEPKLAAPVQAGIARVIDAYRVDLTKRQRSNAEAWLLRLATSMNAIATQGEAPSVEAYTAWVEWRIQAGLYSRGTKPLPGFERAPKIFEFADIVQVAADRPIARLATPGRALVPTAIQASSSHSPGGGYVIDRRLGHRTRQQLFDPIAERARTVASIAATIAMYPEFADDTYEACMLNAFRGWAGLYEAHASPIYGRGTDAATIERWWARRQRALAIEARRQPCHGAAWIEGGEVEAIARARSESEPPIGALIGCAQGAIYIEPGAADMRPPT